MEKSKSKLVVLPVLFGFLTMGFVDFVGISVSYFKKDFGLSNSMTNLLPMMVFVWFIVFSVPTGMMMNILGRKNTVLISLAIISIALMVPLIAYHFSIVLIMFAILGIANTILQVSLNPLFINIVSGEKLTSSLTQGQFVKAIASFLGPFIAGIASITFGNWKMMFPMFSFLTLLSGWWLVLTAIPEEETRNTISGLWKNLSLLKDPPILMFFLAIVLLVGIDLGLISTLPKFLMERTSIPLEKVGMVTGFYFASRIIGTFFGAIFLMKISGRKFYIASMVLGIATIIIMIFTSNICALLILIFILGLAIANVFPIIFSEAVHKEPTRANEVSGLLIMGIAGGAIVPLLIGIVSDSRGQTGAMVVLLISFGGLLFNAIRMQKG